MEQNIQKTRPNDFPELQIGYPERNDVRDPNQEMERIHVNLENFELRRTTAKEITQENNAQGIYHHNR
jgi:hypothetical protein